MAPTKTIEKEGRENKTIEKKQKTKKKLPPKVLKEITRKKREYKKRITKTKQSEEIKQLEM